MPAKGVDGMLLTILKSKITPATVTETHLEYEGSITLPAEVAEAAGLLPDEQVHVLNLSNGERLVTYVIVGERGSGVVCLNGPAARAGMVGDAVTVLAYAQMTEEQARGWRARLVRLDARNRQVE
jgi:aspartate 1-decarboxylase